MTDLWYLGAAGWEPAGDDRLRFLRPSMRSNAQAVITNAEVGVSEIIVLVYHKSDVGRLLAAKRFPQDQVEAAKLWAELVFSGSGK